MCDFWMYSVNLGVLIRKADSRNGKFKQFATWNREYVTALWQVLFWRFLIESEFYTQRIAYLHSGDLFTDGGKSVAFGDFTEIWKIQRKIAFSAIR